MLRQSRCSGARGKQLRGQRSGEKERDGPKMGRFSEEIRGEDEQSGRSRLPSPRPRGLGQSVLAGVSYRGRSLGRLPGVQTPSPGAGPGLGSATRGACQSQAGARSPFLSREAAARLRHRGEGASTFPIKALRRGCNVSPAQDGAGFGQSRPCGARLAEAIQKSCCNSNLDRTSLSSPKNLPAARQR